MFNIVLVGPPGSGKGTQAERLIQRYGFTSIALGALLRQEMAESGPNKKFIESYINSGQLIPDSLSLQLVTQLVEVQPTDALLLFDGFPRTLAQATFLDNFLTQFQSKINGVIFLDVSTEHLLKRLKHRASIEARFDDQDDSKIKTRMQIYEKETLPILNYYKAQEKLHAVNGVQHVDHVTQAIESIVNALRI